METIYALFEASRQKWVTGWQFDGERLDLNLGDHWSSSRFRLPEATTLCALVERHRHQELVLVPHEKNTPLWFLQPQCNATVYGDALRQFIESRLETSWTAEGTPYWFLRIKGRDYGPINPTTTGWYAPPFSKDNATYPSVFEAAVAMFSQEDFQKVLDEAEE